MDWVKVWVQNSDKVTEYDRHLKKASVQWSKCCEHNNQDEHTSLNRKAYNTDFLKLFHPKVGSKATKTQVG